MSFGNEYQETLTPGILIESKVGGAGTLGCFARLKSDPAKIVLLSNSHVLFGDVQSMGGSGVGAKVGQPKVSCCWCCACRVIGNNLRQGFNRVAVNVSGAGADSGLHAGSMIDSATAELNAERPYTNQALYGMITGTPASGFGVTAGAAVEKVGSTTGRTTGTVLGFTTTWTIQSGGSGANGGTADNILYPLTVQGSGVEENFSGAIPNILQMLILADANPTHPTEPTHFVSFGDSGSAVVNAARQVVGLVSRSFRVNDATRAFLNPILQTPLPPHAGTLGIVSPIGPMLDLLDIEIVNNMSGTAPSSALEVIDMGRLTAEREQRAALELTLRDLELEIRGKVLGRAAMETFDRHRREVIELVSTKRRVTVTWHRNQGPAFAGHCLHSFADPDYVIPSDEQGVSPIELLTRMATVLKRHGSPQLAADIDAYQELVVEWSTGCTSLWQLVERMRGLDSVTEDELAMEAVTEQGD